MHHGRVVEQGTHADLVERPNGRYARLLAAQENAEADNELEPLAAIEHNKLD